MMKTLLRNFGSTLAALALFFTAVLSHAQTFTDITRTNLDLNSPNYFTFYPDQNVAYGTALVYQTNEPGCIFSMRLDGSGFTNLYNFSAPIKDTNTSQFTNYDGGTPQASVILYSNKLYGTASFGGAYGFGTVFSINPNGSGFTTLHSLSRADGTFPSAKLVATNGVLFGITSGATAQLGNNTNQHCTVFRINIDGTGFSVLHDFTNGYTRSSLIIAGNQLIGTTWEGGDFGYGSVFSVKQDGSAFTNLHSFNGSDGVGVFGPLAVSSNILYGATESGGTNGVGIIYSLRVDGAQFQILYELPTLNYSQEFFVKGVSFITMAEGHLYGIQHTIPGPYGPGWILATGPEFITEQLYTLNTDGSGYKILNDFGNVAYTYIDEDYVPLSPSELALYHETLFFSHSGGLTKYQLHPNFFNGEAYLANGVYYLKFPDTNEFGYYNYNAFPYLYHYNLGFEYYIDAGDAANGAYLYDFTSGHFWYTTPAVYPFVYDFGRNAWLYYYNTTTPRRFYDFSIQQQIIE